MQSVAVKLLVEREREIRSFVPEESWKVLAGLKNDTPFEVELAKIGGKKSHYKNIDELKAYLEKSGISIENINQKTDKKGNIHFKIDHQDTFTLQKTDTKSYKRLP